MDRISGLPDEIILHILSNLTIKEAVRTSILSKSWNKVCRLYNFDKYLHFDHYKFALQKLVSVKPDGREPDIPEIGNSFTEFVTNELLNLSQKNSPVLKLVLDVAVIDDEDECVDELMELVMQCKVEELCLFVQTNDSPWDDEIPEEEHICYDFPYDVLPSSEWLQSLTLQGCMFGRELDYGIDEFSSLRHLCLSRVMVWGKSVLANLADCCPEIEHIEFDSCTLWLENNPLDLSIFPNLKKASIVGYQYGEFDTIDLSDTHLESFYCDIMECMLGEIDCRDQIRELILHDFDYRFNDFTAEAFPLAVNAKVMIDDVQEMVHSFEASGNCLETLDLVMCPFLAKIFVECENLKHFNYDGCGFDNVYINCPNLEWFNYLADEPSDVLDTHTTTSDIWLAPFPKSLSVYSEKLEYFRYKGSGFEEVYINCSNLKQFNYLAKKLPDLLKWNLPPDIGCINFRFDLHDNLDTSWFVYLRRFLEAISGREFCLHLRIHSEMAEFALAEFGRKLAMLEQKKVHLIVELQRANMQNPAALLDGLLWSIYPTTLTIRGCCRRFIKALCENLDSLTQDNPFCGHFRVCIYWRHNLVNEYFQNDIEDIKKKLTSMLDQMDESSCAMELRLKFLGHPNM